jgi:agmatinase
MGLGKPTFMAPSTFLGLPQEPSDLVIAGIAWDLGTSNRSGAREAPHAIRLASRMLVDGDHPYHHVDPKTGGACDIGDLDIVQGDIMKTLELITRQAEQYRHIIALGGDHTISLPLLRALRKRYDHPIGLIHLDAHIDTWPDNFGGIRYGHGNPFYHAIEEGLIDPSRMIQIGIRSPCDIGVMKWTRDKGSRIISAMEIFTCWSPCHLAAEAQRVIADPDYPVYLTIDIDVLDPSCAPGTGTPEVGGLQTWQVQHMLRYLVGSNLVGMDIVEVCPPCDHSEITALAAATLVWEYLALMKRKTCTPNAA